MNNQQTLSQVVSVEKDVKTRVYGQVSELHKQLQKPDLLNGHIRRFVKTVDDAEDQPEDKKVVQVVATAAIGNVIKMSTELYNIEATKDAANQVAKADITVDGQVLVKDAPATFLLFLDKQLSDLHTFVDKIVTLSSDEEWRPDPNSNLMRTEISKTTRTKKVNKALVLYPATDKHPAQTAQVVEDVVVGNWETTKLSGALPLPLKQAALERIEALQKAVKFAREQANTTAAPKVDVGAKILNWIFAKA